MLPLQIKQHLISEKGIAPAQSFPISGGDINQAARLSCTDGRQLFIKYNRGPEAARIMQTEMRGLQALAEPGAIAIPHIITQGEAPEGWAYLVLEYIVQGHRNRAFWTEFGPALATLHQHSSAQFGLDHQNYIGSLPQSNARMNTWSDFYAEERLRPQMRLALEKQQLERSDALRLENVCARLQSICPEEPPALIHGDLWAGNFLCNTESQPVLIDPAACYAHREMDIAMSRLFGGFDALFYQSYQEAWPLAPGYEKREEIYQLYYLLVHVNLFGGSYVARVQTILKRWI